MRYQPFKRLPSWVTLTLSATYVCAVMSASGAFGQIPRSSDGSEDVIKELAKGLGDDRSMDQIRKDNELIRAAGKGDLQSVQMALAQGAFVNSRYLDGFAFLDQGFTGYTALMCASCAGQDEVVKLLIGRKADLEMERNGLTSLYFAVVREKESVVKQLVQAGAKGNPTQIRLSEDLLRAACADSELAKTNRKERLEIQLKIEDLLKRGADVNAADSQGYTALMYAANLGLVENVKLLLAKGADASRRSKDGKTALSMAEKSNPYYRPGERKAVADLLKSQLLQKKEGLK